MTLDDDSQNSKRLHYELEMMITRINNEQISAVTGTITWQSFVDVATMVASLRAHYLKTVLEVGEGYDGRSIDTASASELKRLREAYTEVMSGFSALEHALERGYIELSKKGA
ncbi:MAG: hypothetical protein ACPHTD_02050 [Gammaproteobacteria bacterium]